MILAMLVLFAVIVIPVLPFLDDNQSIDNFLQPLLCQPGEQIIREQYSRTDSDGTSFSMDVYCMGRDEVRRDETGRWILIGGLGFTIPFLIGLFAFISGANAATKKLVNQAVSVSGVPPIVLRMGEMNTPDGGSEQSLTERLQELEKARSTGLITEEEYARMRKDVLDEGV